MIAGYELKNGPWHDLEWLVSETEKFYSQVKTASGPADRFAITADRIIKHRKWTSAAHLIGGNLRSVVEELNVLYVPQQMQLGPCILFPQRDLGPRWRYGKIRPLYDLVFKDGAIAKYAFLGNKEAIVGPTWLGNSAETIRRIGLGRKAVMVEGFFDLLACRALVPDMPVLSTGTKTANDKHLCDLKMMGVERVIMMFDNDVAKKGHVDGAGVEAMFAIAAKWRKAGLICDLVQPVEGRNDPSQALEDARHAWEFRTQLQRLNRVGLSSGGAR